MKQILDEKGWKNTDLAKASGLTDTYIGYLIRGYTSSQPNPPNLTIETLIKLRKALNISYDELINAYQGKKVEDEAVHLDEQLKESLIGFISTLPPELVARSLIASKSKDDLDKLIRKATDG